LPITDPMIPIIVGAIAGIIALFGIISSRQQTFFATIFSIIISLF
jgi:hypothetical protein